MTRAWIAIAAAGSLAATASADRFNFTIYENSDNADVSGLDLWVDVTDGGTYVDFTFGNTSSITACVSSIYFEKTSFSVASLLNGRIQAESAGVAFETPAVPPNPAQIPNNFGGPWQGNLYSIVAKAPRAKNGINEGGAEWLTVRFDYGGGATFGDVLDAVREGRDGLRMAEHIISLPGGASVWGVSVPAPGSMALMALGGVIAFRRRR